MIWIVSVIAVLAVAVVVGAATGNGGANSVASEPNAVNLAQAPDTGYGQYPEQVVKMFQEEADLSPGDSVKFQDSEDGPALYMLKDDYMRMNLSSFARGAGLPYDEADLLQPLRDGDGNIVAYQANNLVRNLTPEEVNAPDFNLCAELTSSAAELDQAAVDSGYKPDPRPASERFRCTP